MIEIAVIDSLRRKFNRIKAELDERGCRCWAASEALELGMVGLRRWHERRAWANAPFVAGVNNCVKKDLRAVRAGGGFGSQEEGESRSRRGTRTWSRRWKR